MARAADLPTARALVLASIKDVEDKRRKYLEANQDPASRSIDRLSAQQAIESAERRFGYQVDNVKMLLEE